MSLFTHGKELLQYIGEDKSKEIFRSINTGQFSIRSKATLRDSSYKKVNFDPYRSTSGLQEIRDTDVPLAFKRVFPLYVICIEKGSGFLNLFFEGIERLPYFYNGILFKNNFPYPMHQESIIYRIGDLQRVHWIYVPISLTNNVVKLDLFVR
jgi:hypothetical protein